MHSNAKRGDDNEETIFNVGALHLKPNYIYHLQSLLVNYLFGRASEIYLFTIFFPGMSSAYSKAYLNTIRNIHLMGFLYFLFKYPFKFFGASRDGLVQQGVLSFVRST